MVTSAKKSIVNALGMVIILGPPLHWLQILYFVLGAVELLLGWRMKPTVVGHVMGVGRD